MFYEDKDGKEDKGDRERRNRLKQKGLEVVSKDLLSTWEKYLRDLAEYGIFAVPTGELESWLSQLGVPRGQKGDWIVETFAGMGSDPDAAGYLRPDDGGPWAFVRGVARWIHDPERQGMPPLPTDPTPNSSHS